MSPGGIGDGSAAGLARTVEALLFLSPDPVPVGELIDACEVSEVQIRNALDLLAEELAPGRRGLVLREIAGGYALATDPGAEHAARRLLARPKTPPLTPAQAETLAIVAYLQPVSRPEITRIRGVAADSAAGTLLERGLVEEAGRSPFGAVLLRTTPLFLKLFGLDALGDLPDPGQWDPTPEEAGDLRDRLLRAGEARLGGPAAPPQPGFDDDAQGGADPAQAAFDDEAEGAGVSGADAAGLEADVPAGADAEPAPVPLA